ncbi:MAG: translation initiation factor IF-2 associated domain-containing protein, partial [Xanthobacteraceae bacterium]
MTETTKTSGEKLSVAPSKTLTLKRSGVEQGVVRQSFSHGRSKAVVVEKVKRRIGPGEAKVETAAPAERPAARAPSRAPTPVAAPAAPPKSSGVVLR